MFSARRRATQGEKKNVPKETKIAKKLINCSSDRKFVNFFSDNQLICILMSYIYIINRIAGPK